MLFKRVLLVGVGLALMTAGAEAGFKKGDQLFQFGVGYSFAKLDEVDETIDGGNLYFSYERASWPGPWSLGFNLGIVRMDAEVEGVGKTEVELVPATVFAKRYLGDPLGKFQGYIGLGLGVHSTKTSTNSPFFSETVTRAQVAVPLGVMFQVSDRVFLNLGYNLAWLSESDFKSDLAHSLDLGLGYRFGEGE